MRANHKQIFTAAIMAAMGFSGSAATLQNQGRDVAAIPIHKAPAPVKKGETQNVERLLCAGRASARNRKLWPFNGKNRAQRTRMVAGFQSF